MPVSSWTTSVPQGLAGLEHVLDPLEGLAFAAEREEGLAFEVEQLLLAQGPWRWPAAVRAAGEDLAQLAADQRVVFGDVVAGEEVVQADLDQGERVVVAVPNIAQKPLEIRVRWVVGTERGIDVRFIEFMPIGYESRWSRDNYWPAEDIIAAVEKLVPLDEVREASLASLEEAST